MDKYISKHQQILVKEDVSALSEIRIALTVMWLIIHMSKEPISTLLKGLMIVIVGSIIDFGVWWCGALAEVLTEGHYIDVRLKSVTGLDISEF